MKSKISAQFDTIDAAEWAGRWVKKHGLNINYIQISNANPRFSSNYTEIVGAYPNFSGATASVGMALVKEIHNPSDAEDYTTQPKTMVSVIVDSKPERIENMLTSLGGKNITVSDSY